MDVNRFMLEYVCTTMTICTILAYFMRPTELGAVLVAISGFTFVAAVWLIYKPKEVVNGQKTVSG